MIYFRRRIMLGQALFSTTKGPYEKLRRVLDRADLSPQYPPPERTQETQGISFRIP
jgi:hypothetical protein